MIGKMPSVCSDSAKVVLHISNVDLSQIQVGYMFSASWHFNLFTARYKETLSNSTGINSIYFELYSN